MSNEIAPSVSISVVSAASIYDEILPLMKSHFNEISHHSDFKFDVDKEMYSKLEAAGHLVAFIVRHGAEAVGYSCYVINKHPHALVLQAYQDAIYLRPDYRCLGIGHDLIEFADSHFKNIGVGIVMSAVSTKFDFSKTLIGLNYQLVDKLYARRL